MEVGHRTNTNNSRRILVVYVFHIINDRVQRFFRNAIFQSNQVVVCNDPTIQVDLPSYVTENKGYDFGAWSEALLCHARWTRYNHYICIVIGPFLQPGTDRFVWIEWFLQGLLTNNVRLYGPTINGCGYFDIPHVQSYVFIMDTWWLLWIKVSLVWIVVSSRMRYRCQPYCWIWDTLLLVPCPFTNRQKKGSRFVCIQVTRT
jgi:hypothetical protein